MIFFKKQNKTNFEKKFTQKIWNAQLIKIIFKFNWFKRTIDDKNFRKLITMTRFNIEISHRIKLIKMISFDYDKIRKHIKNDLQNVQRVFIALNVWFNSQKIVFLKMLIYWVNKNFQWQKRLIEFIFLNVAHTSRHLIQKLIDLLNFFEIQSKLFVIVIDNVNNNNTLKKKLKKKHWSIEILIEIASKIQFRVLFMSWI